MPCHPRPTVRPVFAWDPPWPPPPIQSRASPARLFPPPARLPAMPQFSLTPIRPFHSDSNSPHSNESSVESERVPFLTQEQSFLSSPDLEDGAFADSCAGKSDTAKSPSVSCNLLPESASPLDNLTSPFSSKWRWIDAIPLLRQWSGGSRKVVHKEHVLERVASPKVHRITPLRRVLRLLALSLMLL